MRELTADEKSLLSLLDGFEAVCESKKLTTNLIFNVKSLAWLACSGIKIAKCERNEKTGQYLVSFTKYEYRCYLDLCCKAMGFRVLLDGTVVTADNEVVLRPKAA